MKIEVNIEKKYFFGLLLIGLAVIGIVGVFAYNSAGTGGNPVVFGHSVDEMDWNKSISRNVTAAGFCIGNMTEKNCMTNWSAIEGVNPWTIVDGKLFFNGNVGIKVSDTNHTLEIAGNAKVAGILNTTGLCIGNECRTAWPTGGGTFNTYDCSWIGGSRCNQCRFNWVCPDGQVAVGVGQQSTGETHIDYVYVRCCRVRIT